MKEILNTEVSGVTEGAAPGPVLTLDILKEAVDKLKKDNPQHIVFYCPICEGMVLFMATDGSTVVSERHRCFTDPLPTWPFINLDVKS